MTDVIVDPDKQNKNTRRRSSKEILFRESLKQFALMEQNFDDSYVLKTTSPKKATTM